MGRNNYFQFRQFRIIQEQAAFKVGTDAVLLGSWVQAGPVERILDVGTGTGVIALMMAQRTTAAITGIEIEKNAAAEAAGNAKNSPWSDRIFIYNTSFQDFANSSPGLFDLIISNPPFFTNSRKPQCHLLSLAKHNHLLPPGGLVHNAAGMLGPTGRLAVILPVKSTPEFIQMAEKEGLYLARQTEVRPNNLKKPHRFLMEFAKAKGIAKTGSLNIHTDDNADFTDDYKRLTRDFYLNF